MFYGFTREAENRNEEKKEIMKGKGMLRSNDKSESIQHSMYFLGANENVATKGINEQITKTNYLKGNDPRKYYTDVANYEEIIYSNIYNNIDLHYYGTGKKLKYDFVVKPGASVSRIQLGYDGVEGVDVNEKGQLEIKTKWGILFEEAPYSYQTIDGIRKSVEVKFKIIEDKIASVEKSSEVKKRFVVGFEVVGDYDGAQDLVIDPYIVMVNVCGGTSFPGGSLTGMAVDDAGNVYAVGAYGGSFPVTKGAFDTTFNGSGNDHDATIFKINSTGSALLYSTFLGGSENDVASTITLAPTGEVIVGGFTNSRDFPVTPGAFQTTFRGDTNHTAWGEGFITKLNANGNGLMYSTYMGGTASEVISSVTMNAIGEVFFTGYTTSRDFPVTPGAFLTSHSGVMDAVVGRLNSTGSALIYCTYLGGAMSDQGGEIKVNNTDEAYVTGNTSSTDFPVTPGVLQTNYHDGGSDAFLTKLSNDGKKLLYSTYIGGSGQDYGCSIALDTIGYAYISGSTFSSTSTNDFPVTTGASQTTFGGNMDCFVSKISPDGNALIYSTFLGGNGMEGDEGSKIAINSRGELYITSTTTSSDYPVTSDALQSSFNGRSDLFIAKFNRTGSALQYSSYIGGSQREYQPSIHLDSKGAITIGASTSSDDFKTTPGCFQPTRRTRYTQPVVLRLAFECNETTPAITTIQKINFSATSCTEERDSLLMIEDTSCVDLQIDSIRIVGADANDFKIVSPVTFPYIISGNSSDPIKIHLSPLSSGTKNAKVEIFSNDKNSPRRVDLEAFVDGQCLTVCPQAGFMAGKKPGDDVLVPVVIDQDQKVSNADSITLTLHYQSAMLRSAGDPTSLYGVVKNIKRVEDEISFTVILSQTLPTSSIVIVNVPMQVLLSSNASGSLDITSSAITLKSGSTVTSAGCSAPFAVDSDCIHPSSLQKRSSLSSNYPNPFSSETTVQYEIGSDEHVLLSVYDVFGRRVEKIIDRDETAGIYTVKFEGSRYRDGLYFYRMKTNREILEHPMIVVK